MENNDIVRGLLDGSEAINRMRKEVEQLTKMLLSLAGDYEIEQFHRGTGSALSEPAQALLRRGQAQWSIISTKAEVPLLELECRIDFGSGPHLAFATLEGRKQFAYASVQKVHESLPLLVELFAQCFPGVTKTWKPFLDAAKYAESQQKQDEIRRRAFT